MPAVTSASKPKTKKKRAKRHAKGKRHTPAERARILDVAQREGLTGDQAAKRFGISTVTYYLWRKKAKKAGPGRPRRARKAGIALDGTAANRTIAEAMRKEVRARIVNTLPEIIESELASVLGSGGSRRGRR